MKNYCFKLNDKAFTQDGFSLVEILIAMAVLSIGLLSIAAMQTSAIKGNAQSNNLTQRTFMGSDHIEYLLNIPFNHQDLVDTAGGTRAFATAGYTYSWTVTDSPVAPATPTEKTIILTLSNTHYGIPRTLRIETKRVR